MDEVRIRPEFLEHHGAAEPPRQLRRLENLDNGEPVRTVGERSETFRDALDEMLVLHGKRLVRRYERNHDVAISV